MITHTRLCHWYDSESSHKWHLDRHGTRKGAFGDRSRQVRHSGARSERTEGVIRMTERDADFEQWSKTDKANETFVCDVSKVHFISRAAVRGQAQCPSRRGQRRLRTCHQRFITDANKHPHFCVWPNSEILRFHYLVFFFLMNFNHCFDIV